MTNNLTNKAIAEFIGLMAVVASLVFVGMQLMLDRKIALAEQYFNRAEAQRADYRSRIESDTYIQIEEEKWVRGERPRWWTNEAASILEPLIERNEMSIREVIFTDIEAQIGAIAFDNLYFQYRQNLLSPEDWQTYRQIMKRRMSSGIIDRYVFLSDSREIRVVAEELMNELNNDSAFNGT